MRASGRDGRHRRGSDPHRRNVHARQNVVDSRTNSDEGPKREPEGPAGSVARDGMDGTDAESMDLRIGTSPVGRPSAPGHWLLHRPISAQPLAAVVTTDADNAAMAPVTTVAATARRSPAVRPLLGPVVP